MHACMHTYIHTYMHACMHAYIHTYIHTYVRTYVPTYVHTYIHTYIHTCMHTYIHTYIRTYVHTYIHAYIHTCIHTHIHTYTHTYIHQVYRSVCIKINSIKSHNVYPCLQSDFISFCIVLLDINECENGNHDCNENATCVNTAGHFKCSCNKGFSGDGKTCSGTIDVLPYNLVHVDYPLILFLSALFN